jgi:predicted GIY-YIG superfamily endonuclease
MEGVYLLHFDTPFGHARHYTGYAKDIERRIAMHRRGTSKARLMEVVHAAGIGFTVARIWEGADRTFERKLKDRHGASRYCPVCKCMHSLAELAASVTLEA